MTLGFVIALVAMVLLVICSALILAGWRNPESKFLVGMVQIRREDRPKRPDPRRDAASVCWSIFGFAAGSAGLVLWLESDVPVRDFWTGSVTVIACVFVAAGCLALAAWVRWGDSPPSLRPAALRDSHAL